MRNDTPQVETREIADDDLDNVSGGLGVTVDGLATLLGTVTYGLPVGEVPGLVAGAAATVTGATGLTGIAGL